MTTITINDVQRLASLSSLHLSDSEVQALQGDLERIIKYIEQLGELDTTGVEPTYQVTGLENVWRDDEVVSDVGRDALLALAPDQQNDQVKVPKVL
jgi:aspartyl-tRNA(Asn)/glutamyl-tRNA(Gln) amidotransferase subunit C